MYKITSNWFAPVPYMEYRVTLVCVADPSLNVVTCFNDIDSALTCLHKYLSEGKTATLLVCQG